MTVKIVKLPIERLTLGEGPHWNMSSQSLYLVDIMGASILRYHPATNTCFKADLGFLKINIRHLHADEESLLINALYLFRGWFNLEDNFFSLRSCPKLLAWKQAEERGDNWLMIKTIKNISNLKGLPYPGFIVPVSGTDNKFVVGCKTQLYIVTWDGKSSKVDSAEVLQETNEPATNRINDGKCDPSGRVWFGCMSIKDYLKDKSAGFYSYSRKKGLVQHFTGVGISNGLAWDEKNNLFYYIDSVKMGVDAFDCHPNGNIENRRTVFLAKKYFSEDYPFPDGMTIDNDGNLWIACFNLSLVIKVDPNNGTLLQKIEIPAPKVTSVAFGGLNLDELYVTTASFKNSDSEEIPPNAGFTFRVTGLGVTGLPMHDFVL